MLFNFKVGVYNRLPSTKLNGIVTPGILTKIKDIDCDIQSYSKELLLKQYGFNIEVNKRMFLDYDPNIKIGTVFYYTNPQNVVEKYEVKAIPWDESIMEVMCLGI